MKIKKIVPEGIRFTLELSERELSVIAAGLGACKTNDTIASLNKYAPEIQADSNYVCSIYNALSNELGWFQHRHKN